MLIPAEFFANEDLTYLEEVLGESVRKSDQWINLTETEWRKLVDLIEENDAAAPEQNIARVLAIKSAAMLIKASREIEGITPSGTKHEKAQIKASKLAGRAAIIGAVPAIFGLDPLVARRLINIVR